MVADPRLVRVGEGRLPTNADEVAIDPFLAMMALAVGVVGVANSVVLGVWGRTVAVYGLLGPFAFTLIPFIS